MDWMASLEPHTLLFGIAALGVLLAAPFALAAGRRLRRLRVASGTLHLLTAAFLALAGAGAGLVAASLHGYRRLTSEQAAARVSLHRVADRRFVLVLDAPPAAPRRFVVLGDQWQIDARILKWRPPATLAGFDTVYRLERLSGRYATAAEDQASPRTVYPLSSDAPLDVWALLRRYHRYLPLADALYGSAAYVPMADGAQYAVSVSTSGLVVRPLNDAARRAVGDWS